MTGTTLREGDIYRWSYREPGNDGAWGRYHCCSQIAIVDARRRLRDTYWAYGSDGRSFGVDDLPKLELIYLGNFSDLDKMPEYNADYYDDADIVNLNHANSTNGNFYLRRGAVRSAAKMMASAMQKLEKSISDAAHAMRRAEELRKTISSIQEGQTDGIYL